MKVGESHVGKEERAMAMPWGGDVRWCVFGGGGEGQVRSWVRGLVGGDDDVVRYMMHTVIIDTHAMVESLWCKLFLCILVDGFRQRRIRETDVVDANWSRRLDISPGCQ